MDAEQLNFLQGRLREAVLAQPELRGFIALLLRLGGTSLVAPPRPDQDIPALLTSGFVMSGPVTMKQLKSSLCHENVARVWKRRQRGIVGIATGYALSDDGLWRQHSWGVLRDGLLETTEPREKYFGILLQGERADFFAFSNTFDANSQAFFI